MAQVKGKFIKMAGNMMFERELILANEYLFAELGLIHTELDDEGWYEVAIFDKFMNICVENSSSKEKIYLLIGKKVYPTIKRTVGLPPHLKTPLDFVLFEAEGFLLNHRGDEVIPRKIIEVRENEVVLQAKAPGYNSKLYEGVFLGILEICGIKNGSVECLGDDVLKISW